MKDSCSQTFDSSHNHPHLHDAEIKHRPREQKRLLIALSITLVMLIIEVIGGLLTNSLALLSDAGHMLSHAFTLCLSFFAIRLSMRHPTTEKSFGYHRAEILAALFNAMTLALIAFAICYHAYFRILQPQTIASTQMFLIALAGLFVNLLTAVVLHDVSCGDLNIKSVFFHLMGDTLSSMAIVIVAIVLYFNEDWTILDPIVSVVVSMMIFFWAYKLIRSSCHILLEATPKHLNVEKIISELKALSPQIKSIHDVHIWEITSKFYTMTAHIEVSDMTLKETKAITKKLNHHLDHTYDITHTNFQFEA